MSDSVHTSIEQDNLVAGAFPLVGMSGTAASILHLERGTVLGQITLTGKLAVLDKDATDGSEEPYGVLAEAAGPGTDVPVTTYVKGEFNADALHLADGTVVADVQAAALARSIIIRDVSAQ